MAVSQSKGQIKVSGGLGKTDDPKRIASELERVTREISTRMVAIEQSQNNSGMKLHESYAGEQGIRPYMLIHVDKDRCFLADATKETRYCTDIVLNVVGNRVYSAPVGNDFDVYRTVPEGTDNRLYVSIYPGYATADPDSEAATAKIRQQVGEQRNRRGGNGLCKIALSPREVTSLSM